MNYGLWERVYLSTDPNKGMGTVVRIEHGRYFVKWDDGGRTWIYAASDLMVVNEVAIPA